MNKYQSYLDFRNKYPKTWGYVGDYKKGEIEILTDISLFSICEKEAKGEIGVKDQNIWGILVTEPVRIRSNFGLFTRFISWSQLNRGLAGAVIIPKLKDEKFIFVKNFRNATRKWYIEFPRGGFDNAMHAGESINNELKSECGAITVGEPTLLGQLCPDPSILFSTVNVYLVDAEIVSDNSQENMEAIEKILFLDENEINNLIKTGEISDGFTLSALQFLKINKQQN